MRTKAALSLGIFLFLIFLVFKIFPATPVQVFKGGTKLGNLNLSGKSLNLGYTLIKEKLENPFYLNFENNSQAITLGEIGIGLDSEKLEELTTKCYSEILGSLCALLRRQDKNTLDSLTINDVKLEPFLENLEQEAQFMAHNTIISFEDFTFRTNSPDAKIIIDKNMFTDKNSIAKLLTQKELKIDLKLSPTYNVNMQHEQTTNLVSVITKKPLLVKYGRQEIFIGEENLSMFISTKKSAKPDEEFLEGYIEKDEISKYLESIKYTYSSDDVQVVHEQAVEAIARVMLFRAADFEINNAVILPLEGKARTNGELHESYLEVIKSQQRLYRFENGKLFKTYIVSTGLTWETPPGVYQVMGKQKMTISYTGNWYMPDYLPIGTINGYRFGFHAIPYHMDGAGNIYSRDVNTMGSPATGGCIQLRDDDALEIFDWADVGTPVYVYE